MTRIALLLLAAVAALRLWLEHHGFPGDGWAAEVILGRHDFPRAVDAGVDVMSALGEPLAAVIALLAALAVFRRHRLAVAAAAAVVVVNGVAKLLCGPTPAFSATVDAHGHNYPSGHAAYGLAFYGMVALLTWRSGHRRLAAAPAVVALAMGPARVLAGFHLVSDVLAGWAVGAAWLLVVVRGVSLARPSG